MEGELLSRVICADQTLRASLLYIDFTCVACHNAVPCYREPSRWRVHNDKFAEKCRRCWGVHYISERRCMFRILALDGGGIKGTYTAAVLDQFEEQLGGPVVSHFDLIVGTSTGGIISLGLACGVSAARILELYKDEGYKIFPPATTGWGGIIDWIFGPKYDSNDLKDILLKYFPNRRFMEIEHNLAITSFDASSAKPVVFKTGYHKTLSAHKDLSVVEVALATSAAPAYLKAADIDCGVMIDGGIWANCPVMVGVTEALTLFARKQSDIFILSIGTTSIPTFVRRDAREGGLLHWLRPASSLLMHAANLGAIEQASKLSKVLVRIDDVVDPGRLEMDDAKQVDDLAQLGWTAARRAWSKVQPLFFGKRPNGKGRKSPKRVAAAVRGRTRRSRVAKQTKGRGR